MRIRLTESIGGQKIVEKDGDLYIEGPFALYDKPNLNNRIYPKSIMEKAIEVYNENYVMGKRSLGELDHPETRNDAGLKDVALFITEPLKIMEDGIIWGKALILEGTPNGSIAKYLIDKGISIGVSSRGLGEMEEKINESENGPETIFEITDYELNCFDLVSTPSIGKYINRASSVKKESEVIKNPEKNIKETKSLSNKSLIELAETLLED